MIRMSSSVSKSSATLFDFLPNTRIITVNDAESYLDLKRKQNSVQTLTARQQTDSELVDEEGYVEERLLTGDDVKLAERGLPPQQYNAFVLYADEDVEFASKLIERMEDVGLKVS